MYEFSAISIKFRTFKALLNHQNVELASKYKQLASAKLNLYCKLSVKIRVKFLNMTVERGLSRANLTVFLFSGSINKLASIFK